MFKKINNIFFIILFLSLLFIPLLFTRWESGGVSEEENRNLAQFPSFTVEGKYNPTFTGDAETWFKDHIGFRQHLISANTNLMQKVFDRALTTSDWKTGKTGDSIYASEAIIKDFAHINRYSDGQLTHLVGQYQLISDWLAEKGIPFYYVQCADKHTIYPERFIASVKQIGNVSKTDDVMQYLDDLTTVNAIYFKHILNENKEAYPVFSHWGDPTHWTDRGAYICYRQMMEQINKDMDAPLKILSEADYDISYTNYEGPWGKTEEIEVFTIKNPQAQKGDPSVLGPWSSNNSHSVWKNPNAGNDKRLLLLCDSYFNNYLIDDIAESFSEVWLIWADYLESLPEILELYDADMVIMECAERVDRNWAIYKLTARLEEGL